jgi:hypothetical protein
MQTALMITLSLHVLSATFWAGSTFTLARAAGAAGETAIGEADAVGLDELRRHGLVGIHHNIRIQSIPYVRWCPLLRTVETCSS